MKMEMDFHPTEWKTGTEALALCMICGAEYPAGTKECPDCKVSLSLVRRCPNCRKIVSAQHTKCVYCRAPFTEELFARRVPQELQTLDSEGPSPAARRFRAAAVSITTFVVVFSLGMFFLHQINKPAVTLAIIAKAQVAHSAELRRTPSFHSSTLSKISAGTPLNITSFEENDDGRWMAVDWNGMAAYLPANDVSVPQPVDANEGANALKFYLAGMDSDSAANAGKAVDEYAQRYPGNAHIEELRWSLAERLRTLAQRGGEQAAALRSQANQQYEQLAAGNGSFAARAREALQRTPSTVGPALRQHISTPHKDEIQIIGGSGVSASGSPSGAHDVVILNQPEVRVRTGMLSQLAVGATVNGRVADPVKANGIVAIPAGAPCELTVISAEPSRATLGLALTSIEVDHRTYAVNSAPMNIRSDRGAASIRYRVETQLMIER
jgi:hypothetical protein